MKAYRCYNCGKKSKFEKSEIIEVPYPHVICPVCDEWIDVPQEDKNDDN